MTRFACWYAAHCPPVLPRHSPRRAAARISAGEVITGDVRCRSIVGSLKLLALHMSNKITNSQNRISISIERSLGS